MNIAILDDDAVSIGMLSGIVGSLFEQEGIKANILKFSTIREIEYAMNTVVFDLILLDINLSNTSGIDFAKKLRDRKDKTDILFVSGCENKVFDTFSVEPVGFVRKNHCLKDITAYLNKWIQKYELSQKEQNLISIKFNNQILSVSLNEVVYIEGMLKKQVVHVNEKKEEYLIESSMKDLEKKLEAFGFIRIHNGYLVNYRYIRLINNDEVILKDGTKLFVSRRRLQEVREIFMKLMTKNSIFSF